jgi:hypothetical protein
MKDSPRVSPETLGVVRAAVFAVWLIEVGPDPLSFWGELPASMHEPVGALKLVPRERWEQALTPEKLGQFKRVLIVLLILSAAGARPYRPTAAATAAALTGHQAVLRGFTFVNHEELALLISTYVLALFPAADGFALGSLGSSRATRRGRRRATPETYAAALDAISLLLLIPYCEIAARRLVRASPEVFLGDSLPHWLASLDTLDREAWGLGPWLLAHPSLVRILKAGFAVTTVFELLGPLCLVAPRLRRAWIAVIVGMHVANRFTMKLFFWQNSALILLLLTGPERWVTSGRARIAGMFGRR